MPNITSAKKRVRQAENNRMRNKHLRSRMRTEVKRVLAAIEAGNKDDAASALQVAIPVLDQSVTKGIIHKNKAARHKSRLNAHIKAM